MKKAILAVGVTLCLMVAVHKIYSFLDSRKPVAAVGECLLAFDPSVGSVDIKILANNDSDRTTDISISFQMGFAKVRTGARVTYDELRSINANKVECVE